MRKREGLGKRVKNNEDPFMVLEIVPNIFCWTRPRRSRSI